MLTNSFRTLRAGVLLVLAAVFLLSECQRIDDGNSSRPDVPISIEATHEIPIIGTKTVRDDNAKIYWTPGDAISLFYDSGINGGSKFVAQNEEVALKTTFSGYISAVTGGSDMAEDDCFFWGLYPYDKLASCDGQTVTMRGREQTGDLLFIGRPDDDLRDKAVKTGVGAPGETPELVGINPVRRKETADFFKK